MSLAILKFNCHRFALLLFFGVFFYTNAVAQNLLNSIPASDVNGSGWSAITGFQACSSQSTYTCNGNFSSTNSNLYPIRATINSALTVGVTYTLKLKVGAQNSSGGFTIAPNWSTNNTCTGLLAPLPVLGTSAFQTYTCTLTATQSKAANAGTLTFLRSNAGTTIYIAEAELLGPSSAPTVTSLTPTSGTTAGGTAVTISGTDFTGATGVTIGGVAATNVTVVSSTSITATTPAGSAGTASVVVTTPAGSNTANTLFTYITPASTDANLSALSLSSGALTPAFASGTIAYSQSVANAVSSITVTPTVNQVVLTLYSSTAGMFKLPIVSP